MGVTATWMMVDAGRAVGQPIDPAALFSWPRCKFQINGLTAPRWDAERMFVFCSCSCSGWVGVRVRVRLNGCFVHVPVRAERLFVFGERCSGAALVC